MGCIPFRGSRGADDMHLAPLATAIGLIPSEKRENIRLPTDTEVKMQSYDIGLICIYNFFLNT
jgi:hypothetical protein